MFSIYTMCMEFGRYSLDKSCQPSACMRERVTVDILSVCLSVCLSAFLLWRRRRFQGWNFILGDDWSVLNVALFWKSKLFWRKSEWNFGRNCSDLLGHRPVIKRFSTWSYSSRNPLPKLSFTLFLRWFLPFA